MVWRIELTGTAAKQLAKLDKGEARRIITFLRQRLAVLDDPRTTGKALAGPQLGSYWRYRVGDYRLICDIQDRVLRILVIEVGNWRDVDRCIFVRSGPSDYRGAAVAEAAPHAAAGDQGHSRTPLVQGGRQVDSNGRAAGSPASATDHSRHMRRRATRLGSTVPAEVTVGVSKKEKCHGIRPLFRWHSIRKRPIVPSPILPGAIR